MSSEALGSDLRGGLRRCLFTGTNPAGLGPAILVFAGLIIINLVLQSVLTIVFQLVFFEFNFEDKRQLTKAAICGLFPAGLAIFYLSWQLAKWRGGDPWGVLNLRKPDFGRYGWPLVIAGFIVATRMQQTRNGRMAVIVLDDGTAVIEVTAFAELFEANRELLRETILALACAHVGPAAFAQHEGHSDHSEPKHAQPVDREQVDHSEMDHGHQHSQNAA